MPVNPNSLNPAGDELLNVYKLYDKRRRAELDLELAKAEEMHGSRSAGPKVLAQLAQNEMKRKQDQQKIQQAGQQAQMTPAQALPPMTPISGDAGRGQVGASIASEIADKVTGGSFVKEVSTPGPVGIVSAGAGPGAQPGPVAQPGAAPQVQPVGPGFGGTPELSGAQRFLRGIGALMAVAGRNPDAFVRGVEQAATGKQVVDYAQVPTMDQVANTMAAPISVLRARMESKDPATRDQARQLYGEALDRVDQQGVPGLRDAVRIAADDQFFKADEAARRKREDPATQFELDQKEDLFKIRNKVLECGSRGIPPEQCLNPGELAIFGQGKQGTTIINQIPAPVTKANITKFQQETVTLNRLIDEANQFDDAMTLDPTDSLVGAGYAIKLPDGTWAFNSPFTGPGQAHNAWLSGRTWMGGTLEGDDFRFHDKFASLKSYRTLMTAPYLHSLIGATMSPAELARMDEFLPNADDDVYETVRKNRQLRENAGLAKLRYLTILNSPGFEGVDPTSMSLSDARGLARTLADGAYKQYRAEGKSEEEASAQLRKDFRNKYGLDIDSLNGEQ